MRIGIIGTGYVGLVSGVCLASKGHHVTCVDLSEEIVNNLNNGIPHIYENGLKALLNSVLNKNLFKATTNLNSVLDDSSIVIIAVGTPSDNGEIDLSQIIEVSEQIGRYLKNNDKYISVVVKSTVIPSTTDNTVKKIIEFESGKKIGDFGIGMNPEFLREGEAIEDFNFPDRIVIGYEDIKTKKLLDEIYSPWKCEKIYVNTRTAEMIKYANNTLLACLISMNNELSNLSSLVGGIDYLDVIKGISTDKRWSPEVNHSKIYPSIISYFTPGAGFGGSCFPKDVQAIRTQGESLGLEMLMTNSILDVNDRQPDFVLEILKKYNNAEKNILILGLAFKPNTDDIRESSSIKILKLLLKKDFKLIAHDPIAIDNAKAEINNENIKFCNDWKSEIKNNSIIIIGTNWEEYTVLKNILNNEKSKKIIIDCKRLFNSNEINYHDYATYGKT